jgi:RNA polymerase sigma factor (sigma-70 family)
LRERDTVSPSERAVVEAIQANAHDLLRYFERRLRRDDAADALGDAMVAVWRHAARMPADAHGARLWMFGIARNIALNAQRGARRRVQLSERLRHLTAATAASDSPADEHLEIRDAIARLPVDDAELIRLVHWDGLSLAEAAELLEIPSSTARGRYQRIRASLRSVLEVSDLA